MLVKILFFGTISFDPSFFLSWGLFSGGSILDQADNNSQYLFYPIAQSTIFLRLFIQGFFREFDCEGCVACFRNFAGSI